MKILPNHYTRWRDTISRYPKGSCWKNRNQSWNTIGWYSPRSSRWTKNYCPRNTRRYYTQEIVAAPEIFAGPEFNEPPVTVNEEIITESEADVNKEVVAEPETIAGTEADDPHEVVAEPETIPGTGEETSQDIVFESEIIPVTEAYVP